MHYETFEVGSFAVNCSIASCGDMTYVIDPGQEAFHILEKLSKLGISPSAILLTHAHFDHIGAIGELQQKFPELKVYVHPRDRVVITHPMNQYPPDYPPVAMPDNVVDVAELSGIRVIETPGHTPGGVCYYFENDGVLFSGDTLFAGSVGRTDLPGGNHAVLMNSVRSLGKLPPETKVIPGHGMFTTIQRELDTNPYLQ